MGVVSVLPLSIPFPPRRRRVFPPKLRCLGSFFVTKPVSMELPPLGPSRKSYSRRSSNGEESEESPFLDEDGVVDDIDGYLNYLSLEYDSVWDTKPSWCQPWTILLTGVIVVSCSWIFLHSLIITAGVLSLICAWWYIFLYSYPKGIGYPCVALVRHGPTSKISIESVLKAYSDMIAERRKKVTSGLEDTFGLRKSR